MRDRRRICCSIIHAGNVVLFRQFHPLIHFDLPLRIGEVAEVHHRSSWTDCLTQIIPAFHLNKFHACGAELMIEGIAMRLLDDDLGLHSGEIGYLPDESFIVAGENASESRLHRRSSPGGNQSGVSLGQFEHFSNSFSGSYFQLRHPDKMASRLAQNSFKSGPIHLAPEHGHGSLTVDDGRDSQFVVRIARLPEATNAWAGFPVKQSAWCQYGTGKHSETAQKITTIPFRTESHDGCSFRTLRFLLANNCRDAVDFDH